MTVKYENGWKLSFILLGLSFFFGAMLKYTLLSELLLAFGGSLFVVMFVIRFDDVKEFFSYFE